METLRFLSAALLGILAGVFWLPLLIIFLLFPTVIVTVAKPLDSFSPDEEFSFLTTFYISAVLVFPLLITLSKGV